MNSSRALGSAFAADDARTREHFDALALRFGGEVRAVDWGSRASQEARFGVLASIGDLRGASVLDVGCGQADLCAWLELQGIDCEYSGVDLSPRMIELARARFPQRRFEVANLLEDEARSATHDYVLASGIFYLRNEMPEDYLRAMVERMFARCRRGLAFNSLSTWGNAAPDPGEFRADPFASLAMASRLSERIALRHDYHDSDFSILMQRSSAP